MKTAEFVHLQVHSEFSLQDSLLQVKDIVKLAKTSQASAVALTDVHNLFGAVKFYQAACQQGVKPIIGCELRIEDDLMPSTGSQSQLASPTNYHLLVYCQNNQGYQKLCELLSLSYKTGQRLGVAYVKRSWLSLESCQGLLAVEPGLHGFSGAQESISIDDFSWWQDRFPGGYYIGIQRLGMAEGFDWERNIAPVVLKAGLPLLALGAVCFAEPSDYESHNVRICIQSGRVLDSLTHSGYSERQSWQTAEVMQKRFSDLPSAIQNTHELAKRCTILWKFDQTFLPDFPVPEGQTLAVYLEEKANQGLIARNLSFQTDKAYQERLAIELGIINKMGFAGYFLIVADFIQWAKDHQIPVGPGRGSGAGSLVAYALKITDIDPMPHGLLFERFLNPERVSMPDFDVDFCMIGRDRVIAYVADHYGKDSVAQIITHGSMAAKASVRDVGRVLGHPYGFVDKLAKLVPMDLGITLKQALLQSPELKSRYDEEIEVKQLLDRALSLEGRVRNVGRHAGGVVISPGKLTDFCALYLEEGSHAQVTHLDMGDIERVGLVKFDFLGLRTLTIIDQAVMQIKQAGLNDTLDIANIPLDDAKTFQLLRSGKTTAVFQLESRGFQELIERFKPDVFADIVALVALYRPGPLQSGMVDDYIQRKHGLAEVVYLHPCMSELLKETYGVIVYQEQVMQIAQAMAGYTLGAADLLRRAMGKKKPEEMAKQRKIFIEGSLNNNIEQDIAERVFDLMEKFAGYGFNKSHSVAYAFISYQTAYLKAHYIDYFMASVLSSDMDNTDKLVHYIEDCKSHGLKLLPPCVMHSQAVFHVPERGYIRFGLGAIKGVGESMAITIVNQRKNKTYQHLLDFVMSNKEKVNRKVLEALVLSGSMDCLGQDRSILLGSIEKVLAQKDQFVKSKNRGQSDLFGSQEETLVCHYGQAVPGWSLKKQLEQEKLVLGLYFSGHPLDPYNHEWPYLKLSALGRLKPSKQRQLLKIGGIVNKQKRMTTKSGRLFLLIELADKTGVLEMACFDDKLIQVEQALEAHDVLIIEGFYQLDRNGHGARFQPQQISSLQHHREAHAPTVVIDLDASTADETIGQALKTLFSQSEPGGLSEVLIRYQFNHKQLSLALKDKVSVTVDDDWLNRLEQILKGQKFRVYYA